MSLETGKRWRRPRCIPPSTLLTRSARGSAAGSSLTVSVIPRRVTLARCSRRLGYACSAHHVGWATGRGSLAAVEIRYESDEGSSPSPYLLRREGINQSHIRTRRTLPLLIKG